MKRVRVLKEMPFAKVWEEFEVTEFNLKHEDDYCTIGDFNVDMKTLEKWFYDGWLEWVEEDKSLADEIHGEWIKPGVDAVTINKERAESIAQIAKEHYQKKFDETINPFPGFEWKQAMRKEMFGEEA